MWPAALLRGSPVSTTSTSRRARPRTSAALSPAAPPPTIGTSALRASDKEQDPEDDQPDRPCDIRDRDHRCRERPPALLVGTDELERAEEQRQADRHANDAGPRRHTRRRDD